MISCCIAFLLLLKMQSENANYFEMLKLARRLKLQLLLPPATKLGQGYIFTGMCDSVHRGGVPGLGGMVLGGCMVLGGVVGAWSRGVHGAGVGICLVQGVCAWSSRGVPGPGGHTPQAHTPRDGYCCGRYASYWNAFLFLEIYETDKNVIFDL